MLTGFKNKQRHCWNIEGHEPSTEGWVSYGLVPKDQRGCGGLTDRPVSMWGKTLSASTPSNNLQILFLSLKVLENIVLFQQISKNLS